MLLGATAAAAPLAAAKSKKQAHWVRPKPEGTPLYSQALSYGDFVFVSGHGVGKGTVQEQTKEVLGQVRACLEKAGSSMDKALKCNVYLARIEDYKPMNEAYLGMFGATPPVRTTVAVAAIPLDGCLVEIEVIAHK
jgi:enamine deaminase RidA (YjgF/YER057c/UK114 family)